MNLGANIFCLPLGGGKILTENSKHLTSWISGISIRYFKATHTIQLPCKYYYLSFKKTSRKKNVSEKSTFYFIFMLIFKLEKVKDSFENEKLNLNLNSIRWKKDKGPENNYE